MILRGMLKAGGLPSAMVNPLGEEPMMIRFVARIVLTGLALTVLTGCMGRSGVWINDPHAGTETLGETSAEHRERVSTVADQDARALAEDLDLLFMTDRPTRLTRWHGR
jgi:hypothetical protein